MKRVKILCFMLVLSGFAVMSLGSGSSTPSSTETVKVEGGNGFNSAEESDDTSTEAAESSQSASDEVLYEITDTDFEYYTNSIGSIEYYGYVEITNTGNNNLYLDKAIFDLEDNNEHLLQSDDFISKAPSVIKPGEKGYFYNGIGANLIDEGVSLNNGINLVPQITVKKATGEPVRYEVTDTELREGNYGSPKVTGRVINNTNENCSYLYINVIFYDASGKVIAITGTSITDLNAGSKVSFECDAMFANDSATIDSIADYQVIAEDTYIQF